MNWKCVEERVTAKRPFGRVLRNVIFENLYADKASFISQKPILQPILEQLKEGDKVTFFDDNKVRDGFFVCSGINRQLSPMDILSELLSTEEDIRNFCSKNSVKTSNKHLFALVVETYLKLTEKMIKLPTEKFTDNTLSENEAPIDNIRVINLEEDSETSKALEQYEKNSATAENLQTESTSLNLTENVEETIEPDVNSTIQTLSGRPFDDETSLNLIIENDRTEKSTSSTLIESAADDEIMEINVKHEVVEDSFQVPDLDFYTGSEPYEPEKFVQFTTKCPSNMIMVQKPVKRKPLDMKTKIAILEEFKKGARLSEIAKRRNLNVSTVHYTINSGRKKVEMNQRLMQQYPDKNYPEPEKLTRKKFRTPSENGFTPLLPDIRHHQNHQNHSHQNLMVQQLISNKESLEQKSSMSVSLEPWAKWGQPIKIKLPKNHLNPKLLPDNVTKNIEAQMKLMLQAKSATVTEIKDTQN